MSRFPQKIIAAFGAAAALLALVGCGSAQPSAAESAPETTSSELDWVAPKGLEGSITFYSANPQGLTDALTAKFTELTGVQVEVFAGETGKITAKLDAEWENPQADVVYVASWAPAAKYAADDRALAYEPFGVSTVTPAWAGDGFTGRDGSALALVVNTNAAPSIPSDWADLTKPEFKNLVLMPDPRESGTARDLIAAMVAAWGEERTWKLFDGLFANGMTVQGANGPALDSVTAGSAAVVFGGVDYSAYSAIAKGESLQVVLPASGTTVSPRPVFILKDSKNPEAAKAFVDFMFSNQGQSISAQKFMIPAQPSVAVADGAKSLTDVKQLDFTWEDVSATSKDVLATFTSRYLS
ncbi:extracellular solute-binding protein [Leucobacter sp. wl10]|uniref:extracellular solute-binding protein n=1 Tax=Leucobacter sp. wl10 TaxID=2304677 RepID=UPI000E5A160C|nr:extracellular solute-binding protein [Leucobacter sp. wl10]RGE22454.1 extracellular solute-binding protein [Leucobacter sp. wl10]